ncbi:MAG TPA: hypothetical protein VGL65_09300 [Gemmatimonadales bacterium]
MHIELTDHLRCPQEHDEAYLVLLPDKMDRRQVVAGHLGCPICGWNTAWTDNVPDFGGGWRSVEPLPFESGAEALLGIEGPGGWIALAGSAGALAPELMRILPGVGIVAINSPAAIGPDQTVSVILSGGWPLKGHSMRGVVLGRDAAGSMMSALSTTLPGLRVVGVGKPPDEALAAVIGRAGEVWVAKKR